MHYLDVACRLLLAAVFVTAAWTKVSGKAGWAAFVGSLRQLDQVPGPLLRPAAFAVVATEIVVAVLLLVPVRVAGWIGFALAGCLLLSFTLVIGRALSRGNRAPCRCFGASSTPLGPIHIVRNLILVCVAVLGLAGASAPGAFEVPYALLAGVAGLVAGILITAFEDLVALFRPTAR
ncbi:MULTISPECIES: MauE/DoxX family redox-associated membrane protein [Nonomuraea]|uniref:MauE/DoxX family redox-associated membrane protein n=1 Tax=Nonomuraea harbinensis TaxID=1286938 RepID=A0ABW1BKB8_9ACTN|nr:MULTISPECIES: MauE/DoxX family redox-associated membrane protein [Nonomuraea]